MSRAKPEATKTTRRRATDTATAATQTKGADTMTDTNTASNATAAATVALTLAQTYSNAAHAVQSGTLAEFMQAAQPLQDVGTAPAIVAKLLTENPAQITDGQHELLRQADAAVKAIQARRAAFTKEVEGIVSAANKIARSGDSAALASLERAALSVFLAARIAQGDTPDALAMNASHAHRLTLDIDAHAIGGDNLPAPLFSAEAVSGMVQAARAEYAASHEDAIEEALTAHSMSSARAQVYDSARRLTVRALCGEPVRNSAGQMVILTARTKTAGYSEDKARYTTAGKVSTYRHSTKEQRAAVSQAMKTRRTQVKEAASAEAKTIDAPAPKQWAELANAAQ